MHSDRILGAIEAALLAFLLSFSGCACLVTAFDLAPVNLISVAIWCAICAAVFAAAFSFRYLPLLLLSASVLYGGYLWRHGELSHAAEAIVRRLSTIYHNAYGWGIISWSSDPLLRVDLTVAVCALGFLIAVVVAWTVCRRVMSVPAVTLSLLPLIACLIVTDVLPSMTYLYLLLLGLLILLLSQAVRRKDLSAGNTLTALVAVPAALALLLLFLAVPREGYQVPDRMDMLFSWAEEVAEKYAFIRDPEGSGSQSGDHGQSGYAVRSAEAVDLDKIGVRVTSRTPVMEIVSEVSSTVYLRGRAYNEYLGNTWADTRSNTQDDTFSWPSSDRLVSAGELTITTRALHENLYLPYYCDDLRDYGKQSFPNWNRQLSYSYPYLMLSDMSRSEADSNPIWMDILASIAETGKAPENSIFTSGISSETAERRLAQVYGPFLTLPDSTRQWAKAVLSEILEERSSDIQVASDIAAFVRDSARYSVWTRRMPGDQEDFAQWFLEESDTGYCVHFATLTAVLLRAAGIPARYVSGYMVNASAGKTTVVREENAHAWAEYWVSGIGWVVLESTPSASGPQPPAATNPTQASTQPEDTTAPTESATTAPSEQATKPTQPNQSTRPSQSTGPSQSPNDPPENEKPPLDLNWLWPILRALGWCLLGIGVLLGQWRLRLTLRRLRLNRGAVNARALARWRYAARLSRRLKETPDKALLTLAQKAKFSQHTLSGPELSAFDSYIRGAVIRLQKKSLPARLFDRLILALY